ncbi:hypothetical protein Dred_1404 [Desulforamulus reducens MI-1]|uniref:Uncharacterized protein n=1 Tax=Desulforamulus reducens (strain ATCC BAA-1160 / DSM 100696 / MI-1) TaxID=349161 RepID=A4J4D1_DESRM|nr:hypothetical protein [Desulforamulus reducens]ABO49934.1 hypothetical protein Dred_1404 [Desulforamulus reducens MI-1]
MTQSNSKAILQTSATTSSTAKIETKSTLRYQPGMGALVRFTALFTTGNSGSTQIIGIGDTNDGFFFGYNGSSFGVLRRKNGLDNWTPQASWNMDKLDGTGSSGLILDPTKGNVYSIQYQWLGFGMIYFYIENQNTGDLLLVHKIPYANANTDPSIFNPVLPLMAQVSNTTNNTNIKLETASAMGFIEGMLDNNAIITKNSIDTYKTGITTEVAILTIRNKDTFLTKTNRVNIKLAYLSAGSDGNKTVTIRLIKNTTLGGTPSYTDINTDTSVVEYDTAGTTLTGGIRILNFKLSKVDATQLILQPLNIKLTPGDTLTISAASASATEIDVGISWEELW